MSEWSDLLTTALLGTARRPLPAGLPSAWGTGSPTDAGTDPAVLVLELAARHRAVSGAGSEPFAGPPTGEPAPGPEADRAAPPDPAVRLLGELLVRPNPDLINFWLARADTAGCAAPALHWTRLARLAAHSTAYDRVLLGRVLGARGRWFLAQNPDWRRLAVECAPVEGTRPRSRAADAPPGSPNPEMIRGKPTAIFEHPDPWPDDVVAAAFAVLGTGALNRQAREYARRVGARLPVRLYHSVPAAAEYYLLAPEATPAQRRMIKECFVIMEQAAFARVSIERAFAPGPAAVEWRRVEIGHV